MNIQVEFFKKNGVQRVYFGTENGSGVEYSLADISQLPFGDVVSMVCGEELESEAEKTSDLVTLLDASAEYVDGESGEIKIIIEGDVFKVKRCNDADSGEFWDIYSGDGEYFGECWCPGFDPNEEDYKESQGFANLIQEINEYYR